jgi:hypothetical protein
MMPELLAEEVSAELDTVTRTVRRYRKLFLRMADGKISLLETNRHE